MTKTSIQPRYNPENNQTINSTFTKLIFATLPSNLQNFKNKLLSENGFIVCK